MQHAVGHQLGDDHGGITGARPHVLPGEQVVQQGASCRRGISVTYQRVPGHTSDLPHAHGARHGE